MSYSVSLTYGDLEKDLGGYTYNTAMMFSKGTQKSLNELNGLKGKEAYPILYKGFNYMRDHKEELEAMNPKNGWGNYEGFLDFIGNITIYCRNNPEATLEVN